jgi:hypothetical protein
MNTQVAKYHEIRVADNREIPVAPDAVLSPGMTVGPRPSQESAIVGRKAGEPSLRDSVLEL